MRTICLLGGTGFIGKYLASRLVKNGWRVKVLTRQRERHRELLVLPTLELVTTDMYDQTQLNNSLVGSEAVINLVGILNENGNDGAGFRRAHVELPQKLITACQVNRIQRVLHISALNAEAQTGNSHYLRTKGEGEDLLHAAKDLQVTSFRPAVMFGEDDSLFNRFASLLRVPSYLFMLPSANAQLAPVWVEDVVVAMLQALAEPKHIGQRYCLCGPQIYTLQALVQYLAQLMEVKRLIIPLGDNWSQLVARIMEWVPGKPYSIDNYLSAQVPSICSENDFAKFGMAPHAIEAVMPKYFSPLAGKSLMYSQWRCYAGR